MAEVDFAFLARDAGVDGDVAHATGLGIDSVFVKAVPAAYPVNLLMRIEFTPAEVGRPHRLELSWMDADGARLLHTEGVVETSWPRNAERTWPIGVMLAWNMILPLPRLGMYSLAIVVDDKELKSVRLRCVPVADWKPDE